MTSSFHLYLSRRLAFARGYRFEHVNSDRRPTEPTKATLNKSTPNTLNDPPLSAEQVSKVTGIVIPLAILIGVCEECTFRGLLPLIVAAKTGLPTAAVVVLSGMIFGVSPRSLLASSSPPSFFHLSFLFTVRPDRYITQ